MSKVLSCDLHDYLEIICMFHYQVRLTLEDGTTVVGEAVDVTSKAPNEWLSVRMIQNELVQVEVADIALITVLTEGARFKEMNLR